MKDITTSWGQVATKHNELKEFGLAFGREFQEDILVWHIATQNFLICYRDDFNDKSTVTHAKAIKAISEYLMFLMVVRPYMVPGLRLRSLYEVTLKSLQDVWNNPEESEISSGEERLARTLLNKKEKDSEWALGPGYSRTRLVSDGVNIAVRGAARG